MLQTLDLKAVAPKAGPQFSPNLHAWLVKNFRRRPEVVVQVYRHQKALFVGYLFDGDFCGARLSTILSLGTKADLFCYGGGRTPQTAFRPVRTFWARYQKLGRCYIDREHRGHFIDKRWKEGSRTRHCLWCGLVQKKVTKKRVVVETSWVNV